MRSETIRRFSLVVGSIVFVLCLVEFPALVNVVDYRTVMSVHSWWAPDINDPELLHIHRPHARQSGSARGGDAAAAYEIPLSDMTFFQWDVTYDHNGFRNDADLTRADMIVVGDSFVEEPIVPNPQLTTSVLAHLRGEVVANLGQSAYGPQQELIVLKRYGLPLRPRTVVWMFFEGNDLKDVIGYRHAMRNPPSLLRSFWTRSFTRTIYHALRQRIGTKPPGVKRAAVIETWGDKKLTMYFGYSCPPLSDEDMSALDETLQVIATAHKLSAAQGARLIFVLVPTKFRVFHSFCRYPQESECRNWVVNDLPERLKKSVGSISSQIGYLDLTRSFVEAVKGGAIPYYPDDEHWSPEGHKIAAEAINEYLSANARQRSAAAGKSLH